MHAGLREMRDKLNAAGATIGNVRGEGYRLETL
jgi:DNA-binding response OmpR family regulator